MLREVNFFPCLYIDGSFITDKSAPRDIDVCVQLPDTTPESKARLESDSNINLALDPKECKRLYTIDVIYWHPRFPTHHLQNVALFERLKPDDGVKRKLAADTKKGILKVIL